LGVELEGMELQEFAKWVGKKWDDVKKSVPNIKLESTVSIGPQVGFEIHAPYVSAQAELKLASVELAKYSAETKNGNVNTSNTLGYTQKTKEGNNPEKTTELNGSNVENSVGFGVGIGPLSVGKEIGQKQDIKICGTCEGNSNVRQYSKSSVGLSYLSKETITEKKYGQVINKTTDYNLFKVDIKVIIGYEIKLSLSNEKK
jgi:hypothetical protein